MKPTRVTIVSAGFLALFLVAYSTALTPVALADCWSMCQAQVDQCKAQANNAMATCINLLFPDHMPFCGDQFEDDISYCENDLWFICIIEECGI